MSKRSWFTLGVVVLLGIWFMVVGYEFLEKENALWQKKVKAAKEEVRRCEARLAKFRNFDQFRTSIRLPYTSDLPPERWQRQYDTVRAGMSESEVEIIMGAPDYARCDLSKENDKFLGSTWIYEIAVPTELAANGQNTEIEVFFGPDGKVKDKSAQNMEPKPSPTPSATVAATPTSTPSGTAPPAAAPMPSVTPGTSPMPTASPQQAAPAATASPTPQ